MIARIAAVALRDLRSGTRTFLVSFILVMPFVLALLLRLLIPGVDFAGVHVAVVAEAGGRGASGMPAGLEFLRDYGTVEILPDRAALERRVRDSDEVLGVVPVPGGFELVRQGGESGGGTEMLELVLASRSGNTRAAPDDDVVDVDIVVEDVGLTMSPLKLEGTVFLLVFSTVFGGMLIALGLVEEKMEDTLSAVNVAAISKAEFVIGKAIPGFVFPLAGSLGIVLIVGFEGVDPWMLLLCASCTSLISVIIGFGIGVTASEPIGAIASMKTTFVPTFASVFGAIFLPERWLWVLYWSPHYWAYRAFGDILRRQATWSGIAGYSLVIVAITAVFFSALSGRIRRGLR